jgi:hypothetical protein
MAELTAAPLRAACVDRTFFRSGESYVGGGRSQRIRARLKHLYEGGGGCSGYLVTIWWGQINLAGLRTSGLLEASKRIGSAERTLTV